MNIYDNVENLSLPTVPVRKSNGLIAKTYDSGFLKAHDTYNAISTASDGNVYYVLSSESIDVGGKMYVYHPHNNEIEFLGDLTTICGEQTMQAIPQGKSHVRFFERNGKLYFATHVGFYELIDGMDRLPVNPPQGFKPYPGGHFLSYDLRTKQFEDLALIPGGEGIVSMTMDIDRGHIYGITWPEGKFVHYDVNTGKLYQLGHTAELGEAGTPGKDFRSLCRSLFVDPRTGMVYYSTAEGEIYSYKPGYEKPIVLDEVNLRLDYFGKFDPSMPGSMGYNWRKIFWYETEQLAYGVHGNSGYLFKLDPVNQQIELVERIASELSRKCGMFDQFSYGYLGFQLYAAEDTIFFLTGGPIYKNGKRLKGENEIAKGAAKGLENLHLVTYNIPKSEYRDHGPIFYENGDRPLYVNSIAIGHNGDIYSLARIERNGQTITDLIRISNPLGK